MAIGDAVAAKLESGSEGQGEVFGSILQGAGAGLAPKAVSGARAVAALEDAAAAAKTAAALKAAGKAAAAAKAANAVATPGTALRLVGQCLNSVDDVLKNPLLLKGRVPLEVEVLIGRRPVGPLSASVEVRIKDRAGFYGKSDETASQPVE